MAAPYILGICGGSGSGKTFFLHQLLDTLPKSAYTLVSQDNYYKKREEQQRTEEGLINFDHPDSIRLDELLQDVKRLMQGETVEILEYTYNNPNAKPGMIRMHPAPILILEGLFIYYKKDLADLIDLKLFVEAEEHIRLIRRLKRDNQERGYSAESIMRDYEKFVAPMYQQYVAPSRNICDLIIPNNSHVGGAVQTISNHLKTLIVTP